MHFGTAPTRADTGLPPTGEHAWNNPSHGCRGGSGSVRCTAISRWASVLSSSAAFDRLVLIGCIDKCQSNSAWRQSCRMVHAISFGGSGFVAVRAVSARQSNLRHRLGIAVTTIALSPMMPDQIHRASSKGITARSIITRPILPKWHNFFVTASAAKSAAGIVDLPEGFGTHLAILLAAAEKGRG